MPSLDKQDKTKDNIDGTRLWLLLMKAHHAIAAYAAPTTRAEDLADSDFRILEALLHKGALPVNTLGDKVFLTTGSISTAIDRLHTRGLVTRTASAEDRRQRLIDLTPKGRKLIDRVFAAHARHLNALTDNLSPTDRRRLADTLKLLGRTAEKRTRP